MTTRRGFFKLVAGAAIASVGAKAASILPDVPILWGDGIHDDTCAFQALIDGKVVEFADPRKAVGAGWFNDILILPHGDYRMKAAIVFRDIFRKVIDGNGCTILRDGSHDYCFIMVGDCRYSTIMNFRSVTIRVMAVTVSPFDASRWLDEKIGEVVNLDHVQ